MPRSHYGEDYGENMQDEHSIMFGGAVLKALLVLMVWSLVWGTDNRPVSEEVQKRY